MATKADGRDSIYPTCLSDGQKNLKTRTWHSRSRLSCPANLYVGRQKACRKAKQPDYSRALFRVRNSSKVDSIGSKDYGEVLGGETWSAGKIQLPGTT